MTSNLNSETIRLSAIAHLRSIDAQEEANILSRCNLEIADHGQRYANTTVIGLIVTLRCRANDLPKFSSNDYVFDFPSEIHNAIKNAINSVLPAAFQVHEFAARSLLVDRKEFEKTEVERLIDAQIDLMIAVATGGPAIKTKNDEYKERKIAICDLLQAIGMRDPNPFNDLWAWYGRWKKGDMSTWQSRREFIQELYRPLLEDIAGNSIPNPSEPSREPTGWENVDRLVERIANNLRQDLDADEYQTIGLQCRECLISLAQAVFDSSLHIPADEDPPSETDAYRMLEGYFMYEFRGKKNEVLRRHAKAALCLANELQHKRDAKYIDAALCSEATRTVVSIVAITSGRR